MKVEGRSPIPRSLAEKQKAESRRQGAADGGWRTGDRRPQTVDRGRRTAVQLHVKEQGGGAMFRVAQMF